MADIFGAGIAVIAIAVARTGSFALTRDTVDRAITALTYVGIRLTPRIPAIAHRHPLTSAVGAAVIGGARVTVITGDAVFDVLTDPFGVAGVVHAEILVIAVLIRVTRTPAVTVHTVRRGPQAPLLPQGTAFADRAVDAPPVDTLVGAAGVLVIAIEGCSDTGAFVAGVLGSASVAVIAGGGVLGVRADTV